MKFLLSISLVFFMLISTHAAKKELTKKEKVDVAVRSAIVFCKMGYYWKEEEIKQAIETIYVGDIFYGVPYQKTIIYIMHMSFFNPKAIGIKQYDKYLVSVKYGLCQIHPLKMSKKYKKASEILKLFKIKHNKDNNFDIPCNIMSGIYFDLANVKSI